MKHIFGIVCVLVVSLLLTAPAAVDAKDKTAKDKGKPTKGLIITAVDAVGKTVTVLNHSSNASRTYRVTSETDIQIGGAQASFTELKVGMAVTVTAAGDADSLTKLSANEGQERKHPKKGK